MKHLCVTSLQNLAVPQVFYSLFSISVDDLGGSMVWDWRVSRAGPMPFYWPSCSLPFYLLLFSHSLLSFFGLVFWGWGLRTDRVLIPLFQPCITNLFSIIIIIIIIIGHNSYEGTTPARAQLLLVHNSC